MKKGILSWSVLCWGLTLVTQAGPISLTDAGYTQNFDTLYNVDGGTLGGGTVPNDAELTAAFFGVADSGWWNGSGQSFGSATDGPLVNSQRMVSLGSSSSTERAITIGRQGSGTLGFGAQFQNNTGDTITDLTISYKGEQWYQGNDADLLSFEYSLDATTILDGAANWTAWTGLDFTSPNALGTWQTGNGNLPANSASISDTITGLSIADGATFFIRFTRNNDDGLAVDDFSITPGSGGTGPTSGPPVFVTSPTVKPDADYDELYSESLTNDVSEVDGDAVTFAYVSGPASAWLSVETNGVISGVPSESDEGLNIFTVEVSDVDGATTGTVHITVIGPTPPTPPGGVVDVDVNWNIEHSVNGISDFGRDRHITVHSAIRDPDWDGEEDKLDYLMNDLDVYFGRDNGSASWKFAATPEDPARPNMADIDWLTGFDAWWKTQYDADLDWHQYESRGQGMIMGSNPHPTYPTLSWYPNGFALYGEAGQWQPMDVETSAEWMVEYLDTAFRRPGETSGELPPQYWEVINEPDMTLMTGQFMVSNWESIWEYHNLVANGVRARMGEDAPLIGGMTWGLHDLWQGDLSRYTSNYYYDLIIGGNPGDPATSNGAAFYQEASYTEYPTTHDYGTWEQWDVVWKEFIDHAGSNMDFYAVHLYDWPAWEVAGDGNFRHGGSVEATLDTLEWYDVHTFGFSNRKPVVLSEYGAVGGYQEKLGLDTKRRAWESLKPFNSMFMQFLERPDYVVKSMPFTPIKATWGDYTVGSTLYRYPYTMMDETSEGSGIWEWTEYIKWYELWSDVDGTRVDTKASDLDLQVDAYVDGNKGYLILNNLEATNLTVNLNAFGLTSNSVSSVQIKHLYLDLSLGAEGQPVLSDQTLLTPPGSVELGAEATMILCYKFASALTPDETAEETKFYGESLSGTTPFRVAKTDQGLLTAQINGVSVPSGAAEAVLRVSGLFWYDFVASDDSRNVITINGNALDYHGDWRGSGSGRWFGTIEIPVPIGYLQANNTVTCKILNNSTYACISLQVTDFSQAPGRSATATTVPVTGVSVSPSTLSMPEQRVGTVQASIAPANASDMRITWTSSNPAVATVDDLGLITAVSAGSATITATTVDGGYSDTTAVTVTPFVPFAVTGVAVHPSARVILSGETAPLTETVAPANAAVQTVAWSSDNPSVATVDSSGVVTAVAEGTAIITATTTDGGFTDTSTITVPPPIAVTGVELEPATSLILAGGTVQLSETVSPSDAVDQSVTWDSGNSSVATVDANGLVTGVATGTTFIVVTTVDGGFTATNVTTVIAGDLEGPVLDLTLDGSDVIINIANGSADADFAVLANTNLVEGAGWQPMVTNGMFDASGNASVTNMMDGSDQIFYKVEEAYVQPASLTIEAEDFDSTGGSGTYVNYTEYGGDGNVGVMTNAFAINWVQLGDWVEFENVELPPGVYQIEYFTGSPMADPAVDLLIDGSTAAHDALPNNGDWDTFVSTISGTLVEITAGPHTLRILANGTGEWQWNMDRFILTKVGELP